MTWKRFVWLSIVLMAFAVVGPSPRAQEPEEPAEPGEAVAPPAPTDEQAKPGFWGNRFALYVEVGAGGASTDDIVSSVETRVTKSTSSRLSLDDNTYGRLVVGWQLPVNRGHLLVSFEAYKENSYEFRSEGRQANAFDPNQGQFVPSEDLLQWWSTEIRNGGLTASENIPQWISSQDDVNGNGNPDPDEVSYAASPDLSISRAVPDDLFNRLQTVDLLYRRDFGGRRIEGRWSAGLRYFLYEGNVPATAWLLEADGPGGYTDGLAISLLSFSQRSSGVGPTGSLGVQFHFLRERLTLEARARAAFIMESLELDSGRFFTVTQRAEGFAELILAEAHLRETMDKSVWQLAAEFGARLRLVDGLFLEAGFSRSSYQDSILLPTQLSIPASPQQANQGVAALYRTQDYVTDVWRGGISFQF